MKKLFIAAMAVCALAGCGDKEATKSSGDQVSVDKNLLSVEVTLPAELFEGQTPEQIEEAAKKQGIKEVTANDDGSVYYKMSKAKHHEMLEELEKTVNETMDDLVHDENFSAYKKVTANKDFTEFDIRVDQQAYENSFDGLGLMGLGATAGYYNVFNGVDGENLHITFNIIDDATDETQTVIFPDYLEEDQ